MKNFFKGFLVGIANIMPGVSGSLLLIVMKLYEKCIFAICNIFKDFKKSFIFLFPIGIGIILGTFLFSNIIEFCLKNYLVITSITFVGFIIGTLPSLFNESIKNGFKEKYLIAFLIAFTTGIILLFYKSNIITYSIDLNLYNYIKLCFIGFIIAFSTIVPGISSTVLLSMIGMYGIYINAINTINITILCPIILGIIVGSFMISKIINYFIKNHYGYTYFSIIGFTISTIPSLIIGKTIELNELIIGTILGIIAFYITYLSFQTKK